jgi:hypothetical protein
MILVWLAFMLMISGCSNNGVLLHDFACKGKATLVGGGSGFSGINGAIDCGEGFTLKTGTSADKAIGIGEPATCMKIDSSGLLYQVECPKR